MEMTGSCLCGAVRYRIDGEFSLIGHCHCSICRKSNGAAFATWGILGEGQFHWTKGGDDVRWYASSAQTSRGFCGTCGAALVSAHHGTVGEVVLASLDSDPGKRPSAHIFVASKAPWHDITDPLPQHAGWPPETPESSESAP